MKGLEGRPLVGVRMASIPPAKIPISTLKSRFTFGLRPPLLRKFPIQNKYLEYFEFALPIVGWRLSAVWANPSIAAVIPTEKLSVKYSSILLLSLSLVGSTAFAGDDTRAAIGGALGGVLGSVVGDAVGGSTGAAIGSGIGGAAGGAVGAGRGNKTEAAIGGGLGAAGGNVIGRQIGGSTGGLIGAALGGAGGGALGNHYGDGNRRYDDDDDYRDRRYYRRAGYRDGYYRHDNGHHYGRYKKWKRHKHHRRYYDD
ncbi:hypothetical protein P4234_07455 [Pseudomonas aeruginosa]|nr:hypothetical protein [Pseudomonas aeruginosa]